MTDNISLNSDYNILSIQVSLDGFSFNVQNEQRSAILNSHTTQFESSTTPEHALEEIKACFKDKRVLEEEYKKVYVTYSNELFTLVPQDFFDKNKLTDYLKFNTKILKTDFLTYDQLPDQELVNVYVPYANINNYFFDCFGSFTFYHSLSVLIKNTLLDSDVLETVLTAYFSQSYFELVIRTGKKLLLANSFTYQAPEDVVYYILFCAEQLNLNPETIKLNLLGDIHADSKIYELLYKYIRHVEIHEESNDVLKINI